MAVAKHRFSPLLLLPVGLAVGCATSPPPPELSPAQRRIERLLVELHLPEYAGRLEHAALSVAGHPEDGDLADDVRLRPRIETQLAPDAVVSDVVRRVSESFDETAVAELERFGESPAGRRVHAASAAPYSWFSRLGYRIFGAPSDESPERVALARKLDERTLSSRATTDLYLRIYEAIVRWYAARAAMDPEESAAVGGIDGLLARERERADAVAAQHGVPFTLYAFSDLSTSEIEEYLAVVESPAGQWFVKSVREALAETIDLRSQAISR
ncbi:MAG TPA: hypothetical protein VII72_01485 [Myxococcota bacterium]|jgi:hypothetical protein